MLLLALDRNEAHSGTRHRFADRIRVYRVVLAAFHIGLGVIWWHQKHLVPQLLEFARPIMRRATRLHADEAGFDLRKKLEHLRAFQLARHRGPAFARQRERGRAFSVKPAIIFAAMLTVIL